MFKAKVTITGSKEFKQMLKKIEHLDMSDLGELVRQRLVDTIDENRTGPVKQPEDRRKGKYALHLKDVIKVVPMSNGIGIGNIDELNEKTPYWRVVNDGGYIPPPVRGLWGENGFNANVSGPLMYPTKPIPAMKYIEKTQAWINKNIKRLLNAKIAKVFKGGTQSSLVRIK